MKKTLFTVMVMLAAAIAIVSCSKDDSTPETPASSTPIEIKPLYELANSIVELKQDSVVAVLKSKGYAETKTDVYTKTVDDVTYSVVTRFSGSPSRVMSLTLRASGPHSRVLASKVYELAQNNGKIPAMGCENWQFYHLQIIGDSTITKQSWDDVKAYESDIKNSKYVGFAWKGIGKTNCTSVLRIAREGYSDNNNAYEVYVSNDHCREQ